MEIIYTNVTDAPEIVGYRTIPATQWDPEEIVPIMKNKPPIELSWYQGGDMGYDPCVDEIVIDKGSITTEVYEYKDTIIQGYSDDKYVITLDKSCRTLYIYHVDTRVTNKYPVESEYFFKVIRVGVTYLIQMNTNIFKVSIKPDDIQVDLYMKDVIDFGVVRQNDISTPIHVDKNGNLHLPPDYISNDVRLISNVTRIDTFYNHGTYKNYVTIITNNCVYTLSKGIDNILLTQIVYGNMLINKDVTVDINTMTLINGGKRYIIKNFGTKEPVVLEEIMYSGAEEHHLTRAIFTTRDRRSFKLLEDSKLYVTPKLGMGYDNVIALIDSDVRGIIVPSEEYSDRVYYIK
jgi:hypothetical protein